MDTPASLTTETLATFEASPEYCLSEYVIPRGGAGDLSTNSSLGILNRGND